MLRIIIDYWLSGGWVMIVIALLGFWSYLLALSCDHWMARVIVNSVPLVGLLGTVIGMMQTFRAISIGGTSSVESLSKGISKALITTQVGLAIALVGLWLVQLKKN